MRDGRASRTAVLTCQGRAVAAGAVGPQRLDDPTAAALLRDDERAVVEAVLAGRVPTRFGDRMDYEQVNACADVMLPRTVAIDSALRDHPAAQLVLLGAGLDGRAWRIDELAGRTVFEVDHPASQQDKRDRVGGLRPTAAEIRFVPVDFTRDSLDQRLDAAGHDPGAPTTWIWEGVVAYLTASQVTATTAVVDRRSAAGSRLVTNYESPSWSARIGRGAVGLLSAVARRPCADRG